MKHLFIPLLLMMSFSFGQNKIKIGYSNLYKVQFIDLETNKSFNEFVRLKRKAGFSNGLQKKIFWEYTPNPLADSSILCKIYQLIGQNECSTTSCNSDWNILNKSYLYEKTGLIENRSKLWIHPPRSKYFRILEFTAFPFENKLDNLYSDTIILGKGWGKHEYEKVISNYKLEKIGTKIIVHAESISILGKVISTFEINEFGFFKIEHVLFDKFKIIMTLQISSPTQEQL